MHFTVKEFENPQERERFRVEARCVDSKVEVRLEEVTEERQVDVAGENVNSNHKPIH